MNISTHSLTKRLTDVAYDIEQNANISTHSLTKRLTEASDKKKLLKVFQLTASRRG